MKKCSLLALILFSFFSHAEFTIENLNEVTHSPDSLSGNFKQVKYLSDFDTSLNSSGKFDYSKGRSVHWQTCEPIENSVTMTPKSIISKQGSTEMMNMQADKHPSVSLLNEVFFSILTAQWQTLESYFDLSGEIEGNNWHVFLLPKDPLMSEVITKVELKGDKYLRNLHFFESNGDHTEIQFTELSSNK